MDELVNALRTIQGRIEGADVEMSLENECLRVRSNHRTHSLPLTRLYRSSAFEVRESAAPKKVMVLISASVKAIEAASPFNHIVVPDGNFRLVLPGVALLHETAVSPKKVSARLQGRTGVIAETLLLGGTRAWSVHELARASGVSDGLAHRVLDRLKKENYLESRGSGPEKTRTLVKPIALAETWSQEEATTKVVLRGYLYGSSPEAVAQKVLQICPEGALGGLLAANSYAAILTRVPFPIQCWMPENFWRTRFVEAGLEETGEGANLDIVQAKGDAWRTHREMDSRQVSPWRAWLQVSRTAGRSQELAEALLKQLHTQFDNGVSLLGRRA